MLFILFNCGKYRQIVSLKQLQLNLTLSCDCTPSPIHSPLLLLPITLLPCCLSLTFTHTEKQESRFRFPFSFPFQCAREPASICQLTIGNRLRQLAGATCNTGNIIIYHNKWHFSSGVCDCAKAKATAGPSQEQLRNQGRPSEIPTRRAINLQAVQKLRICETAMANHLSNFNGHANRAIGLSSKLPCPVSYSQPTPAGPQAVRSGSAGQSTFNLCAAKSFWLIKYLKMLNDLRC